MKSKQPRNIVTSYAPSNLEVFAVKYIGANALYYVGERPRHFSRPVFDLPSGTHSHSLGAHGLDSRGINLHIIPARAVIRVGRWSKDK